jgi:hypothetical protein
MPMIVQARATLALPCPDATERVCRFLATGALDAPAASAVSDQQAVLVRAGVAGISKQVAVVSLPPVRGAARTLIAIRWLATGPAGRLFPALDANLELYPVGEAATEISLTGCYQPPFGRPGAAIDRLVMSRVAEATVQQFLRELVYLDTGAARARPVGAAAGELASTG